jgi:hypothetical protein
LWALLRPESFTPDGNGQTLWDALEKASSEAAEAVSEDLSGGIRTAISAVANGALDALRRNGQPLPEPRALFADAMRIAYRLLFVAYAEDRGLLPVGTPVYDSGYSLRTVRDLAADVALGWEPDGGYLWAALRAQWAMLLDGVDAGDLQIPGFDGGLFDPAKCPILDDPALIVGDAYVRDLIDALCWTQRALSVNRRDQIARRRVNYRELGVEQLGSIHEGLLAFEPQIAAVPMSLARLGGGQGAIIQVTEAGQVPAGAEVLDTYEPGVLKYLLLDLLEVAALADVLDFDEDAEARDAEVRPIGAVPQHGQHFFRDKVVEDRAEHEPENVLDFAFRGYGPLDRVRHAVVVAPPATHRGLEPAEDGH